MKRKIMIPILTLIPVILLLAIFAISTVGGQEVIAAVTGPCDIYASGGTPCVAAHSTVRALYGSYSGKLYQVRRSSDNTTRDIGTLTAGGFADGAAQDSFCSGTGCVITVVYDQSGRGNDMWFQGSSVVPGSSVSIPATATRESLTVSGNKVYSLYIDPNVCYWRDGHLTGIPTGSAPEGMYMVTSGTHYNAGCCFDYGNSETTRMADGAGTMDAINFGNECWFGGCSGSGPWVQADLEWGLYSGGSQSWNPNQVSFPHKYVTAMLKNNGTTEFALRGANAQSGSLSTMYKGALPSGYSPMKKQGAITLGCGGDCCKPGGGANLSAGTFYEGAIVAGYPSDATDNAIQENIIAAGYGSTATAVPTAVPTIGPTPVPGTISIACGSSSAVGDFQPDQYYSGGSTFNNTNTIDVSQITSDPPPVALFNNERYGAVSYTVPGFTSGSSYTVTLYFAETYLTSSGSRLFNVSVNGAAMLSDFDIYASAGGQNKAIARSFTATADSIGQIAIQFTAVTENPKINGIGINPATNNGTRGDVNGSGTVDIVDALLIAQYYVGLNPSGFIASNADVNCSGSIDIVDALLVAQYYVGLITSFPC